MMQFSSLLSKTPLLALCFAFFAVSQASAQLQISAVVDATLSGGIPKAIELFACSDIADLGIYGLESANNGNAAGGEEFTLSGSAFAGEYIYITTNGNGAVAFETFFDFPANFATAVASINGDDAIVLYKSGVIIDVFGEVGVDGTAQPWEYTDGWAARNSLKAPKTTFVLADWTFSGTQALSGAQTNAAAGTPVPIKQFTCGGDAPAPAPVPAPVPAPAPAAPTSKIYDVQGSGLTSPMVGAAVTVEGIVTAIFGQDVYVQDVNGDGNDATSDAILVYGSNSVSVGDLVKVTGTVKEYTPGGTSSGNQPTTEIVNPTYTVTASSQPLPAAVDIGAGGRLPPTSSLAESVEFWESLEAMRVKVVDPIAVSGTNRFGETFVRAGAQVTSVSERGTLNLGPADFNPERIQIDGDGVAVDVGAVLEDVVGVVAYNYGEYEIIPTSSYDVKTPSTISPIVTSLKKTATSVLIGSYNVLNLDVPGDSSTGRFALIAKHIITNMGLPDIVALQEVQDNDGATKSSVTSASLTLQTLIDAMKDINSNLDYQFVDNTLIGIDTNGGEPGGNIRTAFLYNAKRVSYDETSLNAVVDPVDQQTNPANPFYNSRLPLAATFTFKGQTIEVVNVHFASKGGSAPLTGPSSQPFEFRQADANVNGGVDDRFTMSQAIKEYVSGKDNVVVLGDFNEFEFNLPMVNLQDTPLTNLAFTIPAEERYSYIFNGNSQALDHILVSPAFRVAKLEYIHVNAEFAETGERASDHDPLVAMINVSPCARSLRGQM